MHIKAQPSAYEQDTTDSKGFICTIGQAKMIIPMFVKTRSVEQVEKYIHK